MRCLTQVYPALRERLESALSQWLPSDGSAAALLGPWCKVFEGREWEGLLQRSIVPKLAGALASLDINPAAQVLDPFNWVMAWSELLPQSQMVGDSPWAELDKLPLEISDSFRQTSTLWVCRIACPFLAHAT